jgi:hypothetical protein
VFADEVFDAGFRVLAFVVVSVNLNNAIKDVTRVHLLSMMGILLRHEDLNITRHRHRLKRLPLPPNHQAHIFVVNSHSQGRLISKRVLLPNEYLRIVGAFVISNYFIDRLLG